MNKYYPDSLIIGIYDFYKSTNFSLSELANRFKIDKKSLIGRFKKLGLISKQDGSRKTFFDQDFFETIDTQEKAYWLGFLYADGALTKPKNKPNTFIFELSLKPGDVDHIISFAKAIKYDLSKIKTESYRSRLCFGSTKFCTHLIGKGCTLRKSLTLTFPTSDIVPDHLIHHFIRGYFDGDGCVSDPLKVGLSINLLGTVDFLNGVLKWYTSFSNEEIPVIVRSKPGTQCFQFVIGAEKAKKFLENLYKDSSVCLNRKYYRYIIHIARRSRNIKPAQGKFGEVLQKYELDNTERVALEYLLSKQSL